MHLVGRGTYIEIYTDQGKRSSHPIEYMHLRCVVMHESYYIDEDLTTPLELEHVGKKELVDLRHKDDRFGTKGGIAPLILGHESWVPECEPGTKPLGRVSCREMLARKGSKGVGYLMGRYPIRINSTKAITVDAWRTNAKRVNGIEVHESAK